ncbi:hypothetical protein [Candidatus Palauibacter sp.]|uniref:hypothetical protein n=1 Tax=Candidatus Palauibacter sp. TaxID=3101350 RepID=UPI003B02713E
MPQLTMGERARVLVGCLALTLVGTVVGCGESEPPYELPPRTPPVRIHVTGIVTMSAGQPVVGAWVRAGVLFGFDCGWDRHTPLHVETDAEGRYDVPIVRHTEMVRGCLMVDVRHPDFARGITRVAFLVPPHGDAIPPDTMVVDMVLSDG